MSQEFFFERYQGMGWMSPEKIKLRQVIRINLLKIKEKVLVEKLEKKGIKLEKIPFLNNSYWINEKKFPISTTTEYLNGYFYVQEAAAQFAVLALNVEKDDIILDAAAAPGGKTTQMAELMKGCVVAVDKDEKRLTYLENHVERLGLNNIISFKHDSREKIKLEFDKILLDAPCSGNFVTDNDWFNKRNLDGIRRNGEKQKKLLKSSVEMLKKGGVLVYSICSLEPEEGELVVDWAIKNLNLKLEEFECSIGVPGLTHILGKKLDDTIIKTKRIWPEKTQGFFIARFRK